jgi:hypothetical protein
VTVASERLRQQCRHWNADRAHQVMAGKARARQFTPEYQSAAGQASYTAFSVRMRAQHGSPQLWPEAAAKYIAPAEIQFYGLTLPPPLQRIIHAAWCAGHGEPVTYWLDDPNEFATRYPLGSLFDPTMAGHQWTETEPGWHMCANCFIAAFCPICLPGWEQDRVLSCLPQLCCAPHARGEART